MKIELLENFPLYGIHVHVHTWCWLNTADVVLPEFARMLAIKCYFHLHIIQCMCKVFCTASSVCTFCLFRLERYLKKRHMLLLRKSALLQYPRSNAPQVCLNRPSCSTLASINGVKEELFKDSYFRYVCVP